MPHFVHYKVLANQFLSLSLEVCMDHPMSDVISDTLTIAGEGGGGG